MILRRSVLACLVAVLLPLAALADQPMIYARHGKAVGGYDVVAYFTEGRAVKGEMRFNVMWKGAVWLFSSMRNRELFEANPRAYAPRYGGYCAYGMARGEVIASAPDAWAIRDGRLYLIHNRDLMGRWESDAPGEIALANANWPGALRN
ncbi:YHS domain-containing (seleno)protein [Seohaeicola zhoushanensis]|uniref:YHS domain protein n=1 Tax=Seohaeicola zhoushanensis TaxID=1569283 RepID=A0A8J3MB32_9RHOB|nr:YHS domain-containing (seleno)protein [Seohaeicola zhoushanensis]GHF72506.1 hypothetical protein GCM10017056_49280 [Seohaeicola zhoushanensis]